MKKRQLHKILNRIYGKPVKPTTAEFQVNYYGQLVCDAPAEPIIIIGKDVTIESWKKVYTEDVIGDSLSYEGNPFNHLNESTNSSST